VVAFGGAVFEAADTLAAGALAAGAFAVAAAFGAVGAFPAGAAFSTGAFESAASAVRGVAALRVAFGFAAGSPGVDPFDGVVDAVGVVASASLFAEAPLRGRLFDVIASLSPRARPFARTRARQVELRPVAA
jgi:hypothetical protein